MRRLTTIDHALHFNMSARFQLQIAALWLLGQVVVECPIDVDRQRVVALDKILVRSRDRRGEKLTALCGRDNRVREAGINRNLDQG